MKPAICAIALPLSLLAVSAFAQDAEPKTGNRGAVRAACSADVKKFCADAPRGKGQLRGCLQGHEAELSDGCKAALAARSKG